MEHATLPSPFFLDARDDMLAADPLRETPPCAAPARIPLRDFLNRMELEERKAFSDLPDGALSVRSTRIDDADRLFLSASCGGWVRGMIIPAGDLLNDEHVTSSGEADEMAYIISHDLRAPLRAVAGYGHILQKDFTAALGPEGAVILTRIVAETERMNGMLTALATLSRTAAQPLARREMDLGKECEAAWSDAGGGDGLQVCSSVEVNADPSLLRMLFKELLSNSLKSRAAGRPLNVSFHATEIEGGWAGAVVDNGIGFNMRSAAKLFAPFQKMHSAAEFPGHGVGLAVAAKIAHRHGGKIWIVSVEGAGTAVFFTLRRP